MKHNIYDAEQHIDFSKIKKILDDNSGKELICFGGGTAADILLRKLLYQYPVSCFLDNNKDIWDSEIGGVPICSPKILKEKKKGSFIVLILSKHVTEISEQLCMYGLEEDKNFYNIYGEFETYFRIMKYDDTAQLFLKFLDTIPNDAFANIDYKEKPIVGIVCVAAMVKVSVWYAIAQCLLLHQRGYRAVCIVDTLKGFDDYIYFDGCHEVSTKYIEYVLSYVKQKCPRFEVRYITENVVVELDEQDRNELPILADIVLSWFLSRKDEQFLPDEPQNRRGVALELLENNLKSIRCHFEQYSYDTINVFTGIHKHRCLYWWISRKYGIRMSTYDGNYGTEYTSYASTDVSSHSRDIQRLLTEDWLSKEEKETLSILAQKMFQDRMTQTTDSTNSIFVCQPIGMNQTQKQYDIILPLNVEWDSAALGLDDLFENVISWIIETVHFIMSETNATVMIREHPHNKILQGYNHNDYGELLKELKQYGDRVYLCRSWDKVNTYQSILNCKLVLPYTSTIGLEAIMLQKKILVHTNCYYRQFTFADSSSTKEEYLNKVKYYYENTYEITEKEKKEASLLFLFQMNNLLYTEFTEDKISWMENEWHEFLLIKQLDNIMQVIVEGHPICLHNIRKLLKSL